MGKLLICVWEWIINYNNLVYGQARAIHEPPADPMVHNQDSPLHRESTLLIGSHGVVLTARGKINLTPDMTMTPRVS